MRQVLSTALAALIVAALTAVTVNAVAQSPAEPPVSPTALNADTVDRLSAVKATSNKTARKNKLVATDAKGFLPSNILKPKWGLITGRPAILADGLIGWNEVQGIPGGFADGVDDVGYVSATQPATYTVGGFDIAYAFVDHPIGTDAEMAIIPQPARHLEVTEEYFWRGPSAPGGPYPDLPDGMLRRQLVLSNSDFDTPVTFKVRTRVYNTGIAPAAFRKALKQVRIAVVEVPRKRR